MKEFWKDVRETFWEAIDMLVYDMLVPLLITSVVNHYFGVVITVISVILVASIWSAWRTVLEAPGDSLKWKLQWFKEPPSPYVIHKTAHRAARISCLVSISLILARVF